MSIALDRLFKLPAVFSIHDLTKDTFTREPLKIDTAKKFVLRMQEKGYVKQAGPRTSFYYNLVVDRDGPSNRQLEVAELIYPEGIVIGLNVLHAYGWITQIPRTYDLAIDSNRRSVSQIYGVELRKRDKAWFQSQQDNKNILRQGHDSHFTLDSLTPQAALDDIREMRDMWVPDLDDLYLPDDIEHPPISRRERYK